ncbi:MAG TPA: T9SS type A sorting domain-containing protein [Chitinophagaceae bacterium]|nr:T9SS type A sorting domain-containing protein [Chitinophagaceae bacterium]
MRRTLLALSLMASGLAAYAQPLTQITGLRLYEHHSSGMNGGAPFGSSANGAQSGYDFVNRVYYNSFDPQTFGAYTGGQEANIDMVEHNGPFGNGSQFGFTSGVSTIWGGDIKGNGTTKWMEAPASFNYDNANNVTAIRSAYDATVAALSISAVAAGKVYLARIRNSELYVAMRVAEVRNAGGTGGVQDVYFAFDYKYGTYTAPTGIDAPELKTGITLFPNPATCLLHLNNKLPEAVTVTIATAYGRQVRSLLLAGNTVRTVDIATLNAGYYFVSYTLADGRSYTQPMIKD